MSVRKSKDIKKLARKRRSKRLNHELKQQVKTRLRVHRTPKHIYAQIIKGEKVLVTASTLESEFKGKTCGNIKSSTRIGQLVGQRALEAGLSEVAFDRAGFKYHGRVKALADGARESGLKF
jgi:large subunit ribosomal protein L18